MTPKNHLEQARYWLKAARYLESLGAKDTNLATVVSALAIHSAIKSNDSLTSQLLRKIAVRHEQAVELFKEMTVRNLIPSEASRLRIPFEQMIRKKSDADYHAKFFSLNDARKFMEDAEKMIKLAEGLVSK